MTRKSPSRKARDAAKKPVVAPPVSGDDVPLTVTLPQTGTRIDERCVGPIRIVQLANGQAQFQQLYERVTYAPDPFTAVEWTQEWRAVPVVVQAVGG